MITNRAKGKKTAVKKVDSISQPRNDRYAEITIHSAPIAAKILPQKTMDNRFDWQGLIEQLAEGADEDAVEAAKALADCDDEAGTQALVQFVRSHHPPFKRELALYALAWMHNAQLTETFIQILGDANEAENIRAQAAEALGMLFNGDVERSVEKSVEKSSNYQRSEQALLEASQDLSPTVRFWCCYGLGELRSHRAIERLTVMQAQDRALCPRWWYVCEEAEDALARIAGHLGVERVPVHLRKD
jgi:HEAT repeat protein